MSESNECKREEQFFNLARERLALEPISELESPSAYADMLRRYRRERDTVMAIAAMQDHLLCGGHLVGRHERGVFEHATVLALREFQREQAIVSRAVVDGETRDMLVADSRELAFRRLMIGGKQLALRVRSRGYRFELVPPVPVDVLPGRIRGRANPPSHEVTATSEAMLSAWYALDANERSAEAEQ